MLGDASVSKSCGCKGAKKVQNKGAQTGWTNVTKHKWDKDVQTVRGTRCPKVREHKGAKTIRANKRAQK